MDKMYSQWTWHYVGYHCNLSSYIMQCQFFFVEKGPRSRCYGRTAALRLTVQACDEDEEKDD
jgi:hypothetical protein